MEGSSDLGKLKKEKRIQLEELLDIFPSSCRWGKLRPGETEAFAQGSTLEGELRSECHLTPSPVLAPDLLWESRGHSQRPQGPHVVHSQLIDLLSQLIFSEHLLHVRHSSRHHGYRNEQKSRKNPCPRGNYILVKEDRQ